MGNAAAGLNPIKTNKAHNQGVSPNADSHQSAKDKAKKLQRLQVLHRLKAIASPPTGIKPSAPIIRVNATIRSAPLNLSAFLLKGNLETKPAPRKAPTVEAAIKVTSVTVSTSTVVIKNHGLHGHRDRASGIERSRNQPVRYELKPFKTYSRRSIRSDSQSIKK